VTLPALPYDSLTYLLQVEAAAVFEELSLSNLTDQLCNSQGYFGWPHAWRSARLISAVDYVQLDRFRRQVMYVMDKLLSEVDALVCPTYGSYQLLRITNFTGHPGVTVRVGFHESPTRDILFSTQTASPQFTIPQNVAIHGRLFGEGTILAIAQALEARLDVWRQRPPVD